MSSQRDNASCLESLESFLEHSLQPLVLEGLISIREQAKEISQQNSDDMTETDVTVQLLKDVKNWTQVLLDEEVRRILQRIPFLQKLLTALFVMKVKVLSVINMRKDTDEFPLTIPANATFLHHVYIQCSNILIDNRSVLDDMNIVDLTPLVKQGIKNACLACVEWADLLAWGLDGVNVNDVINTIMKDDDGTTKEDVSSTDPGVDDNDDDFTDIANETKMSTNNDEEDDPPNDAVSEKATENADDESMFDLSDEPGDQKNSDEDFADARNDTASSVGESVSDVNERNEPNVNHERGQTDVTPDVSRDQESRRISSSSSPSFF